MTTCRWTAMTPAYIDMLLDTRHSKEARDLAIKELMRMARALDAYQQVFGEQGEVDVAHMISEEQDL